MKEQSKKQGKQKRHYNSAGGYHRFESVVDTQEQINQCLNCIYPKCLGCMGGKNPLVPPEVGSRKYELMMKGKQHNG